MTLSSQLSLSSSLSMASTFSSFNEFSMSMPSMSSMSNMPYSELFLFDGFSSSMLSTSTISSMPPGSTISSMPPSSIMSSMSALSSNSFLSMSSLPFPMSMPYDLPSSNAFSGMMESGFSSRGISYFSSMSNGFSSAAVFSSGASSGTMQSGFASSTLLGLVPSEEVSGEPSYEPSIDPSETPTACPSIRPTAPPTRSPTTSRPSATPSYRPTEELSDEPSYEPSEAPTSCPSIRPTAPPTRSPTTSRPSATPSYRPTRFPVSVAPSTVPTTQRPSLADETNPPTIAPSVPEPIVFTMSQTLGGISADDYASNAEVIGAAYKSTIADFIKVEVSSIAITDVQAVSVSKHLLADGIAITTAITTSSADGVSNDDIGGRMADAGGGSTGADFSTTLQEQLTTALPSNSPLLAKVATLSAAAPAVIQLTKAPTSRPSVPGETLSPTTVTTRAPRVASGGKAKAKDGTTMIIIIVVVVVVGVLAAAGGGLYYVRLRGQATKVGTGQAGRQSLDLQLAQAKPGIP